MVSLATAIFVCCLFVATVTPASYIRPLQLSQLSQGGPSSTGRPEMLLIALCLDGQNVLNDCERRSTLLRQLLHKVVRSLQTEIQQSETEALLNAEENQVPSTQSKRSKDNLSGFYSNW